MSNDFRFRQFSVSQDLCAMKVGTDGVLLGAWAGGGSSILDVGCGTGVISLMMAQRFPHSLVTALDVVEECCIQTRQNADSSPWGSRVTVRHMSLQDYAAFVDSDIPGSISPRFDAIVSNPPFFLDSLKNPDRHRTLARHADSLPFDVLTRCVRRLLADEGVLSVILAEEACQKFIDEAWFSGLYLCRAVHIVTKRGKPVKRRLMMFCTDRSVTPEISQAVLLDDEGHRSEWFSSLTSEFYL